MSESNGSLSLDLDAQDEAPQIDVTVAGHKITVDLVAAHTACVAAPFTQNRQTPVSDLLPGVREYLIRAVIASTPENVGDILVTDTQACRFYWYLVEQMAAFEKKVLPDYILKRASPISSDSILGATDR